MNSNKKSHEQNVDNLEIFTTRVSAFPKPFNPYESRLSITNQLKLKSDGDNVLKLVAAAENVLNKAISDRTTAFANLDGFVTRLGNAVRIIDAPEQTIKQFDSLVREFRNKRVPKPVAPVETAEATGDEAAKRKNTKHNSGMDSKIDIFSRIVSFLSTLTAYNTNETDLTTAALEAKLQTLKQTNSAFLAAEAAAIAARQQRQIVLYTEKTGLVPVALAAKTYVKSTYGATSPEYKSISGILFTKIK